MRRREEKRRKFHEAVVNTLFPPPSPPSPPQPTKDEDVMPFNVSYPDIELETRLSNSATSSDEDSECEASTKKPTRAQRKRMQKKKLKEDASRRNQIIGPLLPSMTTIGEACESSIGDARRNVWEESRDALPQHGCSSQKINKVKQRRKAKRQAKDREQI